MSIQIVNGSLLDCEDGSVILQQVNCQNAMGSGVAKEIITKYPSVKSDYNMYCTNKEPMDLLGKCQLIEVSPNIVANLFGQLDYGNSSKTKKVYTNYIALESALESLKTQLSNITASNPNEKEGIKLAIPYGIGCGLAGGDWDIVLDIIERQLFEYGVTIYKL